MVVIWAGRLGSFLFQVSDGDGPNSERPRSSVEHRIERRTSRIERRMSCCGLRFVGRCDWREGSDRVWVVRCSQVQVELQVGDEAVSETKRMRR
jgi:hypothetical protein